MSQDLYDKYFKLFSNCILSKGFKKSLIVDIQRNQSHLIPNDLLEILIKSEKVNLSEIFSEYGEDNRLVIEEYFDSLIELELGFFCDENELNLFPKISLNFNLPYKISDIILEGFLELNDYKTIIPQLEKLRCQYVEIIFYETIENEKLNEILNLFFVSSIKHIGLILKYDKKKNLNFIKESTSTKLRLSKIILHTAKEDKFLNPIDFNLCDVRYISDSINSFFFCGNVEKKYFTVNMYHFTESQNHNTCLNKKISIDKNGYIKNCPSMRESFGNIKDTSLEEALNHPNFKKYWNINKDQIEVCKDCEFRHICTDCRAYLEDPENQYSKPLKCGYNPYTNEWSEWSTNPLKQKAIEFYGMQELIKKDV